MKIVPAKVIVNLTLEDFEEMVALRHLYRRLLDRHPDWWTRRHLGPVPILLSNGPRSHALWLKTVDSDPEEGILTLCGRVEPHTATALQLFDIPTNVRVNVNSETDMVVRVRRADAIAGAERIPATAVLLCENNIWREGDPTNVLFTGVH